MAFFKPGDRVTVRTDLKLWDVYFMDGHHISDSVNDTMMKMLGRTVTIDAMLSNGKYGIAECAHNWTDEMFEEYINRNAAPLPIGSAAGHSDILQMLYGVRT